MYALRIQSCGLCERLLRVLYNIRSIAAEKEKDELFWKQVATDQSTLREEDALAHEREVKKCHKRHEEMKAVKAQLADVDAAVATAKARRARSHDLVLSGQMLS